MGSKFVSSNKSSSRILYFSGRSTKAITKVLLLSFFLLVFLSVLGGHHGLCQTISDKKTQESECNHCHHEEAPTCHNEESEHLHDTLTLKIRSEETEEIVQDKPVSFSTAFSNKKAKCCMSDRPPDIPDGLVLHKSIVLLI